MSTKPKEKKKDKSKKKPEDAPVLPKLEPVEEDGKPVLPEERPVGKEDERACVPNSKARNQHSKAG